MSKSKKIDFLILFERIKCKIGIHKMDWTNEDGEKHCWYYKKIEKLK